MEGALCKLSQTICSFKSKLWLNWHDVIYDRISRQDLLSTTSRWLSSFSENGLFEFIIFLCFFSPFCENENWENNNVNTLLWNDENHKAGWDGNAILYCYFNAASMANACRPTRQQIFHHRISRLALELARANSMIKIWKWRVKSHRTPRELLLSTDSGRMFVVSPSALIFAFGSSRKCLNATHKKAPTERKSHSAPFLSLGMEFRSDGVDWCGPTSISTSHPKLFQNNFSFRLCDFSLEVFQWNQFSVRVKRFVRWKIRELINRKVEGEERKSVKGNQTTHRQMGSRDKTCEWPECKPK